MAKKIKSFQTLLSEAKKRDSYWVARSISSFTEELHQLAEQRGISRAELARRLGTSPAYITKIFGGDANFTVETMVRLARAVGGQLHLHLSPQEHEVTLIQAAPPKRLKSFSAFKADEYRHVPTTRFEENVDEVLAPAA
jgi:transcriptional regulator with XRE-family HTH domain